MLPSSLMAIQLTLLIISCSLYTVYSSSSSSFSIPSSLALLVLVSCLSLLFSNLRHLIKTSSHKTEPAAFMEGKNAAPRDELTAEGLPGIMFGCSERPASEECTEERLGSDDNDDHESLIEISLVDGQCEQCPWKMKEHDLLAGLLPDLVLDKREIGEEAEENLIEIDIATGSIKA